MVFPAYGAPGRQCDTGISALTLVTNLMTSNRVGVVVQVHSESSENRVAETLGPFSAVDSARPLVTMSELALFKEVHKCPAKFQQGNLRKCLCG